MLRYIVQHQTYSKPQLESLVIKLKTDTATPLPLRFDESASVIRDTDKQHIVTLVLDAVPVQFCKLREAAATVKTKEW